MAIQATAAAATATHREFRAFGPPGCGKTTWISHQVQRALMKYQPDEIFCVSFTRAAAVELAGRETGLPRGNVGTIHSICYHAQGCPPLMEVEKDLRERWSLEHPRWKLDGDAEFDEPPTDSSLLQAYNRRRAQLRDRPDRKEQMLLRHKFGELGPFIEAWEEFKGDHGAYDFTDLLLDAPGSIGAKVLFVDEAQDLTPLQWRVVRNWGARTETYVVAGDDDQCQPGETLVETRDGPKRIDALDPADRLLAYDRRGGRIYGTQKGYSFRRARREYTGLLYTVSAGGRTTRCTDGHWWLARWTEKAKRGDWNAVYLMRKGPHFRVGWAQMFRADGCTHLNARAALEDADALWVLKVFDDKADAYVYESVCAAKYGIPTTTFNGHKNTHLTQENTDRIFAAVDSRPGGLRALRDHGLRLDRPLINRQDPNFSRYGSTILKVAACNLISGLMKVPVYAGCQKAQWEPITVETAPVKELPVYSLDVEKHHTYIADGIVTHNCIYDFLGASPEAFLKPLPEDRIRILGHSYRLPRAVYEYAERWIAKLTGRRQPKEYEPREEGGLVERRGLKLGQPGPLCAEIADRVADSVGAADGQNVMVLASCGYMLRDLIGGLRSRGVPFHNPYRRKRGDWNPLRGTGRRLLAFLRCARAARDEVLRPAPDWWSWMEMLSASETLQRGAKAEIRRRAADEAPITWQDLEGWLTAPLADALLIDDLEWLGEHLTQRFTRSTEYPLAVIRNHGEDGLKEEPRLIVGTVHSVKGGEADVVYVFPDISFQAYREAITQGQAGKDALTRMAYVAMTRARRELHLCEPSGKYYVKWL